MGVEEVRPVRGPVADLLPHGGPRSVDAALARLEHLHGRADQVADGINVRVPRFSVFVHHHRAILGSTSTPRTSTAGLGIGRLAEADEDEIRVNLQRSSLSAGDDLGHAAIDIAVHPDDLRRPR